LCRDELRSKGNQFRFYVETLSKGTKLNFAIRRDDYLLRSEHQQLRFDRRENWLMDFVQHCNTFSEALINEELNFYEYYRLGPLQQFYQSLLNQFDQLDAERECLLQISWGTGWEAKTIGISLEDEVFYQIKSQFRLGRRNVDEFPKSRRLIESGNTPEMPLGWVKMRVEKT